jgi:hypothetical protein
VFFLPAHFRVTKLVMSSHQAEMMLAKFALVLVALDYAQCLAVIPVMIG